MNQPAYPTFSRSEMDRRRAALLAQMRQLDVQHVIAYGSNRLGSPMQWFSGWPATREAMMLISEGHEDVLLVQFYNHVPNARDIVQETEVAWGGKSTISTALSLLKDRGVEGKRLGIVGALPFDNYVQCVSICKEVVNLNDWYVDTRAVKSDEEIEWMRHGANLTDRAMDALRQEARPGLNELDLANITERAYVARGGVNHIHFFAVTDMQQPTRCVPAQFPSRRTVKRADVIVTELSASYWGYPGQVLRTFVIAEEPTQLYRDMHGVADAAFDAIVDKIRDGVHAQEIVEAASVITEAGFAIYDDLVHGFGGDHLPAILVRRGEGDWDVADFTFRAGMTIVVQPNVISSDRNAGVQTGELMLVTATGVESLHHQPRGLQRIGG